MRLAYKQRPFKTYIKISHSPSFMAAIKALGGIEFRGKVKILIPDNDGDERLFERRFAEQMDGTSNITFIGHQTDPNLVLISAKGLSAFIIRSNLSGSFSMYLKTIEDLELTYNTTLMFYGKGPPFYNNMKMHPDAIRAIMQKRNYTSSSKRIRVKIDKLKFFGTRCYENKKR